MLPPVVFGSNWTWLKNFGLVLAPVASLAGDRVLPGRRLLALAGWEAAVGSALAVLLTLATRIPLRTHYLLNWDAAQFALGLRHFDVIHHQPHPPGYPGYELAGRLLEPLFGDPNQALVAISVGAEAAGAVVAFWFARSLFGSVAGWISALAVVASPLYWYYGEAADTYALEPPLAMGIAWLSWRAWRGGPGSALAAAAMLGLSGSFRPSTEVLLCPLLAVALIRLGSRRTALMAAGTVVLLTAAWVLPLTLLSGGPVALFRASLELGSSVTSGSAIWKAGRAGLQANTSAIALGLIWELGLFVIPLLFGLLIAPRLSPSPHRPGRDWAQFAWIWAGPALLTFLLIHIGQVAYVQVFAPILWLYLGPALGATCSALGRPRLLGPLAGTCLAANVALFFLPSSASLAAQLSQHDRAVSQFEGAVGALDPDHTALVLDAYASGNYRTAQVYLPSYQRVAVARDGRGQLGEIFGDEYSPEGFSRSSQLRFRASVDTFVFPDAYVAAALVADPSRFEVIRLGGGQAIRIWRGAAPVVHGGLIWLGSPFGREDEFLP